MAAEAAPTPSCNTNHLNGRVNARAFRQRDEAVFSSQKKNVEEMVGGIVVVVSQKNKRNETNEVSFLTLSTAAPNAHAACMNRFMPHVDVYDRLL